MIEQWKHLPKGTPVYATTCPKWGLTLKTTGYWFCIINEGKPDSVWAADPNKILATKKAIDKFLK